MGARYEAFASPLNTRITVGLAAPHPAQGLASPNPTRGLASSNPASAKRPGAFCSLFPETDKPFGSIGNFFDIDLQELHKSNKAIWCFNPPFVEDIMERGIKKFTTSLAEGVQIQIFGILPHWEDSPAVMHVKESKYLKSIKLLKAGTYHFESDKKIIAKFDCIEFILSSL